MTFFCCFHLLYYISQSEKKHQDFSGYFFFQGAYFASFWNCRSKSFRPAMEMSLSANKKSGQRMRTHEKKTEKVKYILFGLNFYKTHKLQVLFWRNVGRKGGILQRSKGREGRGRGESVNGKNSVRRLVTTLQGKLLWELFPI